MSGETADGPRLLNVVAELTYQPEANGRFDL